MKNLARNMAWLLQSIKKGRCATDCDHRIERILLMDIGEMKAIRWHE
jgi:hypothetical protein